jgi:hypothetical protein
MHVRKAMMEDHLNLMLLHRNGDKDMEGNLENGMFVIAM